MSKMFSVILDSSERVPQNCQSEGSDLHSNKEHKSKTMALTSIRKKV